MPAKLTLCILQIGRTVAARQYSGSERHSLEFAEFSADFRLKKVAVEFVSNTNEHPSRVEV